MTLEDLKEKMKVGKIYPIQSKEDDGDGFPGEKGCPLFLGRCRLNEDGRLECNIRQNTDKECPQGNHFFIEEDEGLKPWEISIDHKFIG